MTKPKPLVPMDLLKSVTQAKPAEAGDGTKAAKATPAAGPRQAGPKANTKPAKAVQSQTRTSNRGK